MTFSLLSPQKSNCSHFPEQKDTNYENKEETKDINAFIVIDVVSFVKDNLYARYQVCRDEDEIK